MTRRPHLHLRCPACKRLDFATKRCNPRGCILPRVTYCDACFERTYTAGRRELESERLGR